MIRAVLVVVLLAARATTAAAAEGDELHPLVFDGDIDPPILAATGFTWIAGTLLQSTVLTHPSCDPCLASDVNALDRSLAGRHNSTADAISYATLSLLLVAPLIVDGVDLYRSGARPRFFADDLGVYLEAITVDAAINQLVKLAVNRPRPLAYDPNLSADARASSETYVSFYSEHASLGFTAAAAWVTTFALHHRRSRGAIAAVAAIASILAGTTAALRIVAGKHFYSDVAVGALAGTTVGITVPLLHRRRGSPMRIAIAPLDGGAMATLAFVQ